jgi:hypothetical protein
MVVGLKIRWQCRRMSEKPERGYALAFSLKQTSSQRASVVTQRVPKTHVVYPVPSVMTKLVLAN